jgi:type I restriction enzyme S subunit
VPDPVSATSFLLQDFAELTSHSGAADSLRSMFLEMTIGRHQPAKTEGSAVWQKRCLRDVAEIYSGDSVSADEKALHFEGLAEGRPYIGTKDVLGNSGEIDYDNGVKISMSEKRFKVAPPGSILICAEGGSAGRKIGVVSQEVCFGNKLFAVCPRDDVTTEFLLRTFQAPTWYAQFRDRITGIIGGVSLANFKALEIGLPPLTEQRQVAAVLSDALAHCDALEAAATARQQARRSVLEALLSRLDNADYADRLGILFRRFAELVDDPEDVRRAQTAVLDLAIRGKLKLTGGAGQPIDREERRDVRLDAPIGRMPVRVPEAEPFSLPENWRWVLLESLVNPSRPISYGVIKLGPEDPTGTPVLRCSDVRFRRLDLHGMRRVAPAIEDEYQRTRLLGGEVLVSIRGTLGGCAVVPPELGGHNIAREVAMVDPNNWTSAEYLLNVISAPYFQDAISRNVRGIAYKGINLSSLAKLPIPVPPRDVQQALVSQVRELMEMFEDLYAGAVQRASAREELLRNICSSLANGSSTLPPSAAPTEKTSERIAGTRGPGSAAGEGRPSNGLSARITAEERAQEALIVGAIVNAFFSAGGEPLGNFRLQKAVYFAKRWLGETNLDQFVRRAAGPYSPSLRYEGGIAVANALRYVREARGRFGFGYIAGPNLEGLNRKLEQHERYAEAAQWVCSRFRLVDNQKWELLATVDFALRALSEEGRSPTPDEIVEYIEADPHWWPKVQRLGLTPFKVESAMLETRAIFGCAEAQ